MDTTSWIAAAGVALILMFAILLGNSIEAYRLKRLELRVAKGWHALKDQQLELEGAQHELAEQRRELAEERRELEEEKTDLRRRRRDEHRRTATLG